MDFTITQAFLAEYIIPNDSQEISADVLNSAFQALMADIDAGLASLADDIAAAVVEAFGESIGAAADNALAAKESADTAATNSGDAKTAAEGAKASADAANVNVGDVGSALEAILDNRTPLPSGLCFAYTSYSSAITVLDLSGCVFPDAATRTDAQYMFYNCSALQSLTLPEGFGAAITNAYNMFSYCVALQSLTLPEGFGAAITSASAMFQGCRHLQTISKFSLASVSNTSQAFYSCSALENVGGFTGLKISLSLSSAIHLTLQSVVNIVTEAAAVNTAQTLTLHANAYARAQADTEVYEYNGNTYTGIIALANAKGWTIASA